MISTLGWVLCVSGIIFILIAASGLIRLPDALSRQHAATKAATVAVIFFSAGVMLVVQDFSWTWRLVVIMLFLFLTLPLASHVLGRAAYKESESSCQ
jgi:multicomponent Na+:H+ antiporter subunit G